MNAKLMKVGELMLPKRLVALIDAGLWPHTEQARRLDHNCNVPIDRIRLFAPKEDRLYLAVPPFHTIAEQVRGEIDFFSSPSPSPSPASSVQPVKFEKTNFWSRFAALDQISPDLTVDIGDFGIGSENAIVLDYRQGGSNPPVLRLEWHCWEPSVWVRCADTFDEFADMLGLDKS